MPFAPNAITTSRPIDRPLPLRRDEHRARQRAVEVLKALAVPVRLQILDAIGTAELTAGRIVDLVGGHQPNVSQHLAVLVDAGLLHRRRDGRNVRYRRSAGSATELIRVLGDFLSAEVPATGAPAESRRLAD